MGPTSRKSSFIKGIWHQFTLEDGMKVSVNSLPSGKERVYLGDALVSQKYSLIQGIHNFSYKGDDYTINLKYSDQLTGVLNCKLFKNGSLLSSKDDGFFRAKSKVTLIFLSLLIFFLIFGYSIGYLIGRFVIELP